MKIETHPVRLTAENAKALIGAYDIVADGSDNFDTRFLVNDTCFALGKTLVFGGGDGIRGPARHLQGA